MTTRIIPILRRPGTLAFRLFNCSGYTMIEMVMVIFIVGVLASVALKSMKSTNDVSRAEETKAKMDRLAFAIIGNPNTISDGVRTDFGYIGDVGALPVNWNALVTNPGGYSTWKGPYVQDEFSPGSGNATFKLDAWGKQFSDPTTNAFSSSGGPVIITRKLAETVSALLYNRIILSITDAKLAVPGVSHRDSVKTLLIYPNGTGSTATAVKYPTSDGLIQYDSIPIGVHALKIVFIQQSDTLFRKIAVNPGQVSYVQIQYFSRIW